MSECIYVHKFNEIKIPKPDSHIIQNMGLHTATNTWLSALNTVLNYLEYLLVSNGDIQFS